MARSSSKKPRSYLTPNEVAELLMVSPTTVRHWASEGKLKSALTPGGHRRFMRSEVARFARQNNLVLPLPDSDNTRILIVDDDKSIGDLLTRMFERSPVPCETMITDSGFEAGRLIDTFKPHIVLLDLMMPGIDGFEVCRNIKSDPTTRAIRVIAMTGYSDAQNVSRILDSGAETCLSKPFEFDDLMEAVGFS